MKAIVLFNNDPSVGIFSESFTIELPIVEFEDCAHKEEVREKIKKLYNELNGEFKCSFVEFDFESELDKFVEEKIENDKQEFIDEMNSKED